MGGYTLIKLSTIPLRMGSCPHCDFSGKAELEEIGSHEGDLEQFYRGQLVCPSCDAILGGVQSYSMKADTDDQLF